MHNAVNAQTVVHPVHTAACRVSIRHSGIRGMILVEDMLGNVVWSKLRAEHQKPALELINIHKGTLCSDISTHAGELLIKR